MSVDKNASKQMEAIQPVQTAKAALSSLLAKKEADQKPSQVQLAKQLKKEIASLRAQGVTFAVMSAHLKESGISISKSALGAAVKVKKRPRKTSPQASTTPAAQ